MSDRQLQPITIFEGPDCGGKSTLAHAFRRSRLVASHLLHHGPYPQMKKRLPQLYVEAMRPMLEGCEEQIWDRCWLSEPIYGHAFRNGMDRVGPISRRHLERIALRHGAIVVLCLPPWETVRASWLERKNLDPAGEYLEQEAQLRQVYDRYANLRNQTSLPVVMFDYTRHTQQALHTELARARSTVHPNLLTRSAGNFDARVVLVGDRASDHTDDSTWLQFPFTAFGGSGCSRWLTQQLEKAGILEDELYWLNANDPGTSVASLKDERRNYELVAALGEEASKALEQAGVPHEKFVHPQAHKRFSTTTPYPLLDRLIQILGD